MASKLHDELAHAKTEHDRGCWKHGVSGKEIYNQFKVEACAKAMREVHGRMSQIVSPALSDMLRFIRSSRISIKEVLDPRGDM